MADQQRAIASHLYLRIREDWTVKEAIDFCEIMLHQPFFEARIQGILILERYQKDFPKSLFPGLKDGWPKTYAITGLQWTPFVLDCWPLSWKNSQSSCRS